jgi:hypothetical protein
MTFQQEPSHDRKAGQIAHGSGSGQTKDDAWVSDLIDEVVAVEDWKKLFRQLARSKNVRAKALLLQYRFGRIDLAVAGPARRIDE